MAESPDQIDLSPYAYVGNNPILKTDPHGDCPFCIIFVVEAIEALTATEVVTATVVTAGAVGTAAIISHAHHSGSSPVMQQDATSHSNPAILQARPRAAPGSRPGQGFTTKGKKDVIDENKAKNNGKTVCENCGVQTTKPEKSQKGVTPPSTDTQVDHVDPSANGGSGTPENGQVLCRGCNIEKSDKVPTPPAPTPPTPQKPPNQ